MKNKLGNKLSRKELTLLARGKKIKRNITEVLDDGEFLKTVGEQLQKYYPELRRKSISFRCTFSEKNRNVAFLEII